MEKLILVVLALMLIAEIVGIAHNVLISREAAKTYDRNITVATRDADNWRKVSADLLAENSKLHKELRDSHGRTFTAFAIDANGIVALPDGWRDKIAEVYKEAPKA